MAAVLARDAVLTIQLALNFVKQPADGVAVLAGDLVLFVPKIEITLTLIVLDAEETMSRQVDQSDGKVIEIVVHVAISFLTSD